MLKQSQILTLQPQMNRNKTLQMFEKINKDLLAHIREDVNYRMPPNYIKWEVLSQIIAIGLSTCDLEYAKVDISAFIHSYRIALWFAQKAPMYCLSHELIEAFDQTDALHKPGVLCGWQPSLPTFLLAIPKGAIYAPDGAAIDYLTVSCSNINHPEWNSGKWKSISIHPFKMRYPLYFQYSTVDSQETVWTSGTAVSENGNTLIYDENSDIGRDTLTPEDRILIKRLRNLVINILLTLEFLPSLVSDIEKKELPAPKGFGEKLQKHKTAHRFPRWLGKGFSIPQSDSLATIEEIVEPDADGEDDERTVIQKNHSSPIAHWRRGHWRVLETGEGKRWKNAKRIWIKPIYVNF
ncbi:hypothetical protein [Microcoleus sp. B4-C1]|uniref:hypothetical protein n=1 Tax=Microcoleus sp. B4-C1 TaxID=2818660 RepID=UPI002FD5819C